MLVGLLGNVSLKWKQIYMEIQKLLFLYNTYVLNLQSIKVLQITFWAFQLSQSISPEKTLIVKLKALSLYSRKQKDFLNTKTVGWHRNSAVLKRILDKYIFLFFFI